MALITLVISVEVSLILANRLNTIVAGRTGSKHLCMVNRHHRRKHIGRMTVFAHISGLHMCRILARCIRAVMTANAIADNVDVIEIRRQPANGAMAIIAVVAAGDMRRVLAFSNDAVMTGATAANDLGMIDDYNGHKHRGAVTVFTDVRRLDVCRVLADRFRTVVAVDAIGGYQAVVEGRRQPASGGMAIIAGVTACDMCRLFANCNDAVMARSAGANDLCVIDSHCWRENIGRVAVLAHVS